MRVLYHGKHGELSVTAALGEYVTCRYVILSHTWGADKEEVTLEDLVKDTGKDKPGYKKIQFRGG